jgi:hypothetical protein
MTAPAHDASTHRAADLARLVCEALAHASADSGTEDAEEVRAVTDAMVRLLIGTPLRSDGRLTIVSLAAEAGLRRNKLTHKHTGLKDLFYALVKARGSSPEPASEWTSPADVVSRRGPLSCTIRQSLIAWEGPGSVAR